jgi:glycosyltransferase involved in cell wall biosynthesis
MLSLIIPTYNRNEKVLRLLKRIYELDGVENISITVIDNCSVVPTRDFLVNNNFHFAKNTLIIRNNGNIGLGGNIINSFLNCNTEWIWLLGDDDLPIDNAIKVIFNEISRAKDNDFLIKFNSTAGNYPTNELKINDVDGLIQFCDNFGFYSNLLFISNSVFRTKYILPETFFMANGIRTLSPHMIAIFRCVEKGYSVKMVNKFIINHGTVDDKSYNWDYERVISGILHYLDLEIDLRIKKTLLPKLFLNYVGGNDRFYGIMLLYPYRSLNRDRYFWSYFLLRAANLFSNFRYFYLIILGTIIRYKGIYIFFSFMFRRFRKLNSNNDLYRN